MQLLYLELAITKWEEFTVFFFFGNHITPFRFSFLLKLELETDANAVWLQMNGRVGHIFEASWNEMKIHDYLNLNHVDAQENCSIALLRYWKQKKKHKGFTQNS